MKAVRPWLVVVAVLAVAMPEGQAPAPPPVAPSASAPPPAPAPIDPNTILETDFGTASLLMPPDCLPGDVFDLVIFFHGSPAPLKESLARSRLRAAVLTENVGKISGDYGDRFGMEPTFEVELKLAVDLASRKCPQPGRRVGRIAVGAWSAGFAAALRWLAFPAVADRVDAVLLADGLHSALMDRRTRAFPPDALLQVETFARRAIKGEKLMVITHSEIETRDYASTTESSNFLLERLGLQATEARGPGPVPGMQRLTRAAAGRFVLEGYAGGEERAHGQHLAAVGDTFFTPLREFWQSR